MADRKKLLRVIRRSQTIVSAVLFTVSFLSCWHITGFDITKIQLSKWGATEEVSLVWNSIVCALSVSIFVNSMVYIKHNHRIRKKALSYCLFGFVSMCLFIVGAFNVNYFFIHNLAAYLYFFAYPLVIFIFAYVHKTDIQYRQWCNEMIVSALMIILPLICIYMFDGMAIAEIAHIALVIYWNLRIALLDY